MYRFESLVKVYAALAVVLLAISPLPAISIAQDSGSESISEETIMLEKSRPAVVMVVAITYAVAFWAINIPELEEVGLRPPIEVKSAGFGSGFLVSPDGYIITNGHVVNDFDSEFQEHLPLIKNIALKYAEAYAKMYGAYPDMETIQRVFIILAQAYLNNLLKLQDYNVIVYACLGKAVTGIGNIEKCQIARIVESRPFEKEDLALLKIEVKHAPSLIVSEEEPKIGENVWVLGYPGAVTFHQLLSETTVMVPTITSGIISGYREKFTGLTVLQSDVTVNHGNSGGPMLNHNGEVIAVTSFGSSDPTDSGREVPGFNFFIPAKYVIEMMKRNGVDNTQDPVMSVYEEGLRLYFNKHYSAAIEKFETVKQLSPGFPYVDDYIADARAAVLRGEDVPLNQGISNEVKLLIPATIGFAAVAGLLVIRRMKSRRVTGSPRQVPPEAWSPAPPSPSVEENLQHPMPAKERPSTETPATESMQYPEPSTAPQAVHPLPRIKYCWNCGRPIPEDAVVCPYCLASQEEV